MAQKKQCPRCNSYYNASTYTECPYCGGVGQGDAEGAETAPRRQGIFSRPRKKANREAERRKKDKVIAAKRAETSSEDTLVCSTCGGINPVYARFCKNCGSLFKEKEVEDKILPIDYVGKTMPRPDISGTVESHGLTEVTRDSVEHLAEVQYENKEIPRIMDEHDDKTDPSSPHSDASLEEESLRREFDRVGKTVGKWVKNAEGEDIQPVVGWLVGIQGAYFGRSFILKKGKNRIGRSSEMDIKLLNDESVSRKCVATLFYDARGNEFSIMPDDSDSLCYINGNAIYERISLRGYEEIEFGDSGKSKYIFVPFCGDQFIWENWEKMNDNMQ